MRMRGERGGGVAGHVGACMPGGEESIRAEHEAPACVSPRRPHAWLTCRIFFACSTGLLPSSLFLWRALTTPAPPAVPAPTSSTEAPVLLLTFLTFRSEVLLLLRRRLWGL